MPIDLKSSSLSLRPRARIMRTLGEELISNEVVAVIELVKNSYDADASKVEVVFDLRLEDSSLIVRDDGHGMSLDVVERAWMEPATDHKKKIKLSPYLNRRLLGEKGVGRFASARLASELELTTREVGSADEVFAYFDWTQFDDLDKYLDEIIILAESRLPQDIVKGGQCALGGQAQNGLSRDGSHGSILKMEGLKKAWVKADFDQLSRGLSRLIAPFSTRQDFSIFLRRIGDDSNEIEEVAPPEIIKYPHYELRASLYDDGSYIAKVKLNSVSGEVEFKGFLGRNSSGDEVTRSDQPPSSGSLESGPFDLEVLVWDRDQLESVDQKIGSGLRSVRSDLDSIAGISIYRDDFRVMPYGEPDNDWLKLDLRRVQNPTMRLSNNQISGYVKISSDDNPDLKDQSNREGLDNNRAYLDLRLVVKFFLGLLEPERYKERKVERSAKPSRPVSIFSSPDIQRLREKLASSAGQEDALKMLDETAKGWEDQIIRIKAVMSRYHTLATVGQLVDKVVHDGRQPLSTIHGQSALALEAVEGIVGDSSLRESTGAAVERVQSRLTRIKDAAGLLDLLFKRIEPLGGRKKGRPTKVYLNEIIKSSFAHFDSDISAKGIKLSLPEKDDLVRVDALELQEVMINLISNSIYWLGGVPRENRSIVVKTARIDGGAVEIIFADSGPGVARENRDAVFEPYFSTKPDGVGLGLVISGEIIRDYYDGDLELLDTGPLPGAVFRIIIRKRV